MLMDGDGDLMIRPVRDEQGAIAEGLMVGNTVYQNQYVILSIHKGELKEFPTLGVGLPDMVNDHDVAGWENEVSLQLQNDGMKVSRVAFGRGLALEIEAEYGS